MVRKHNLLFRLNIAQKLWFHTKSDLQLDWYIHMTMLVYSIYVSILKLHLSFCIKALLLWNSLFNMRK